jgi:hypothetical protein
VQRRVEHVTGPVAREHPPGPVAAMRGGREADDEKRGVRRSKPWDRAPPVRLVGEGGALGAGHLLAPGDEPRAGLATGDARVQFRELGSAHASTVRLGAGRALGIRHSAGLGIIGAVSKRVEDRIPGTRHGGFRRDHLAGYGRGD